MKYDWKFKLDCVIKYKKGRSDFVPAGVCRMSGHGRGRHRGFRPVHVPEPGTNESDARHGVRQTPESERPHHAQRHGLAIPASHVSAKAQVDGHRPIDVQEGQLHRQRHHGIVLRDPQERDVLRSRIGIQDIRRSPQSDREIHRLLQQRKDQEQNKMDAPIQIQGGIHPLPMT